jgi:glycosyltransferase involved in cell wall biosynthesis
MNDKFQKNVIKISVIIPCFNASDTIANQLNALERQNWKGNWEVIVSDNGSNDNTLSIVERYAKKLPNLHIVDASDQKGAAHARNVGAKAANGDFLAFCDADDEVGNGWLEALAEAFVGNDFVASKFDSEKMNALWIQKTRTNTQKDGIQKYNPSYFFHAGGSGIGIKRILHEKIGGFDESMMVLEDTDYCFRMGLAGVTLTFVQNAVVHVRYKDTLWGIYKQAFLWGKGNVKLYKRYRKLGMPQYDWKTGLYKWRRILKKPLWIRSRMDLARWLWHLGWSSGRLAGCCNYIVFAP